MIFNPFEVGNSEFELLNNLTKSTVETWLVSRTKDKNKKLNFPQGGEN